MDFEFSEEQNLLRDTLAGFLADHYSFETRRAVVRAEPGWRPQVWQALANDLSLFGAGFPESLGGTDGGAIEHSIVMEEFGKALVVEPYLSTLVIGGNLLKRNAGVLANEFVPSIIEGRTVIALAGVPTQITATRRGADHVLNGKKSVVVGGPWATHLVIATDAGLFLVDANAKGLSMQSYPTFDGGRASDIALENVVVPAARMIGGDVERVVDEAICAICAEAVGAMRQMLAMTVSYAAQRKQFGVPIATFQVLQHRMADMFSQLEQSAALTQVATMKLDAPDAERMLAASAAKVQVANASKFIGQAAIQIHGGMGITEELALGQYFRRVTAIGAQFGSADHHLRRYAELSLANAA